MNFSRIGVGCFLATYAVVFGLEWLRLIGRSKINRALILLGGAIGLATHTTYLIIRNSATHLTPLLSSSQDWLLVLAWLAVVSYLFLTVMDRDLAIGVFILPIVLILTTATYFVSDAPNRRLDSLQGWKMLHAALLVLGMLGVLVGFVLSMMYLVQQWRLRHRHLSPAGFGLPNLEKLARLNRWAIMIAVPLLTLGMGTGVGLGLYAKTRKESIPFNDPVIIGSSIAWLAMFVLFIWLITTPRTTGRQVASLTLWAAGFLMFTLVGLQVATGKKIFDLKTWHVQAPVSQDLWLARHAR
ncbi:MAG: cytochrome c biogenesis protein CcsA [Planctomycetota bacterium]